MATVAPVKFHSRYALSDFVSKIVSCIEIKASRAGEQIASAIDLFAPKNREPSLNYALRYEFAILHPDRAFEVFPEGMLMQEDLFSSIYREGRPKPDVQLADYPLMKDKIQQLLEDTGQGRTSLDFYFNRWKSV